MRLPITILPLRPSRLHLTIQLQRFQSHRPHRILPIWLFLLLLPSVRPPAILLLAIFLLRMEQQEVSAEAVLPIQPLLFQPMLDWYPSVLQLARPPIWLEMEIRSLIP